MDSLVTNAHKKPHVIFVPFPAQSHVKAMLKLAELLHHKGLQITFVNTENIHKRMLKSGGPHCLDGSSDFRFEAFPDGIPRNSEEDDVSELILPIVDALSSMYPKVYTVAPMQLLLNQISKQRKEAGMSYSLWKEETECFQWLDSKEPNSVIYVNYGSHTVMSLEDLTEFAWGLANSNHYFLWIIRSNLVVGESAALPPEFEKLIETKGFIASWCSQEKVLNHPSVGGFLTHGGWGSTIESLSAGVPMICWPYLWDQLTNCRYISNEWGVGLEMGKDVKREEVQRLVQELMGEGGLKMRIKATNWKEKAIIATSPDGSSSLNVNKLVEEIIIMSTVKKLKFLVSS
nr:UDP-glycosyltransferase 85C2-like [Tanacetum cinerariifolium]